MIYNIQRFCVHDGYGIRTVVFFKGCQLRCEWCANPESQKMEREIGFYKNKCVGCGQCEEICKQKAIDLQKPYHIDLDLCNLCGDCVYVCPAEAYQLFGEEVTCEALVNEVMKDWRFYKKSGGGVTLSGGEPSLQGEFLINCLRMLKRNGIHTAIETHGYMDEDFLDELVSVVDLFLFDVKHMDSNKHQVGTGVSNQLIQENLKKLAFVYGKDVIMRIPLIPEFNDDDNNLSKTALLAKELGLPVDLLPFHNMAKGKYDALQRNYKYASNRTQDDSRLKEILELFTSYGIDAKLRGR